MQFREIPLNRRRFMNGTITSAVAAALGSLARAAGEAPAAPAGRKTILSFYCDDTGPYAGRRRGFSKLSSITVASRELPASPV